MRVDKKVGYPYAVRQLDNSNNCFRHEDINLEHIYKKLLNGASFQNK